MTLPAILTLALLFAPPAEPLAPPPAPTTQPTTVPAEKPEVIEVPVDDKLAKSLATQVSRRLGSSDVPLRSLRELDMTRPGAGATSTPPPGTPLGPQTEEMDLWLPPNASTAKDTDQLLGVLIYCSPGEGPMLPPENYRQALADRHLAWISPRTAGNARAVSWRVWTATRAARWAATELPLDPGRIYVAGLSGGGKVACISALAFPETFTGVLSFCGPAYYRDLAAPGPGGNVYPGYIHDNNPRALLQAKTRPFILFTGDNDFNLIPSQVTVNAMKSDGFKSATLAVLPGGKHAIAPAEELTLFLKLLDAPAEADINSLIAKAATLEKSGHMSQALATYRTAASRNPAAAKQLEPTLTRLKALRASEQAAVFGLPKNDPKATRFVQRWEK